MAIVYENRDFLAELGRMNRATRSIVYCGRIATLWRFERINGVLKESQKHYPAEQVPESRLKDKFRKLTA
jgi:hypothetical protein